MIALIVGIVFLVFGLLGLTAFHWADEFVDVLQGSLPPILILSGLAALALGLSQIRDKMAAKKEEKELAEEEAKAEAPKPEEAKPEEAITEEAKPEQPEPGEPEKEEESGQ
jgi:outer membrane biosynthesis protein TonB